MASNYPSAEEDDWVREAELLDDIEFGVAVHTYLEGSEDVQVKTKPCKACYGTGLVEVQGQETDCLACEGWGDVEIS